MPKILYSRVIEEDLRELKKLEKRHRYSHLFQRVRMLRLLKSKECRNLTEAARTLGYSWRHTDMCSVFMARFPQVIRIGYPTPSAASGRA